MDAPQTGCSVVFLSIFSAFLAPALTACDTSPQKQDARDYRRLWKTPQKFCERYFSRHPDLDRVPQEDIVAYNLTVCAEHGYGMAADLDRAARWAQTAVQMGDTDVLQRQLERSLKGGEGHAPDPAEAVHWLGEAAMQGDTSARDQLVTIILNGTEGYPPNPAELAKWLEKLAAKGDDEALHWLIELYMEGTKGFPPRPVDAERLLSAALKRNERDAEAMYNLGLVLAAQVPAGLPLPGTAVTWFSRSAEGGYAKAQYWMGRHLLRRHQERAQKNSDELLLEAYRYFTKAALQGHAEAMCQQAILLWTEKAVHSSSAESAHRWAESSTRSYKDKRAPINYPNEQGQAIPLFRRAAEAGSAEAHLWLGKMYASGNGYLLKDAQKALEHLEKSAASGLKAAATELADHLLRGDLGPQDIGRARELLEGLAQQDDAAASFRLGMMYCGDDGSGVPANAEKAIELLKKAASSYYGKGADLAALRLGKIFEFGMEGLPPAPKEALKWYKQASHEKNIEASLRVGRAYENGELGEARDLHKAFPWYGNVTDKSPEAVWRYGAVGRLTEINEKLALRFITDAAQEGHAAACRELAEMTARGEAKQWNLDAAWHWAAEGYKADGDPGGYYAVGAILLGLPGPWDNIVPDKLLAPLPAKSEAKYQSMNRAQRQQFLRKAAMANTDEARAVALEKIKFASSKGSREASLALAELYDQGKFVPKSAEEAKKYRALAREQEKSGEQKEK